MELTRKDGQYFWVGWMAEQRFHTLLSAFLLLSLADLFATLRMLPFGIREGNALAEMVLLRYGAIGFVVYKCLLVLLIVALARIIDRRERRLAVNLLWGGILVMGYVSLMHLSVIVATAL